MSRHLVVTHFRPQVSDLFAIWLIQKYGSHEQFANIEDGLHMRYIRDGGRSLRDEQGEFRARDETKTTYSGVGGGKYDEHGKKIIECEASLVGRDLGLLRDLKEEDKDLPREEFKKHTFKVRDGDRFKFFFVEEENLKDFFAAVVRDDITGSPLFSFGNLTDTLFHLYPTGMRRVTHWSRALMEAASGHGAIPRDEREILHRKTASIILATIKKLEEHKPYHENASKQLRGWLVNESFIHRVEPLNLVDAVAVMKRAGANWRKWMLIALRAELTIQHRFHTETAAEAKKAKIVPVTLRVPKGLSDDRLEERRIAFVETDDPLVQKYLFSREFGYNAAIVIKKNSKGQVQIFPGSHVYVMGEKSVYQSLSFLMPVVAAFVRSRELMGKKLLIPSWNELTSDHGPKSDFTWFFYSKPGWLMNGSLTATDVPPTTLTLEEIEEVVLLAIHEAHAERRKRIVKTLKERN